MISARGTKTVRIQRRKSGLDFSIKGGREHGIGVVVSEIKEGGAGKGVGLLVVLVHNILFLSASKELSLGDEILAVNGHPLYGLSHQQVVSRLRTAGSSVVLLIRPNQRLQDVFSTSTAGRDYPGTPTTLIPPSERSHLPVPAPHSQSDSAPLPQGWTQKLDQKTGRIYYEK